MIKKLTLWFIFLLLPVLAQATHIVGGVLNYAYNGGNIYTVTLKLYRDCGSNSASFPGSITISVRGANGATFTPSRDLTISLGTVKSVTAAINPCGVPPNPMPCVQEGTYTKTISLPPNTGGYHLFYQVSARNLSLTNINSACNCIGESFYAYIPNNSSSSNNNSNAVFTAFPPLFLCLSQPFSFNHSATDADGDSLAYSLYTPYNGDNGTGSLDPTFSGNTASFTPVTYNTGYTTNNPLGPSPFNLNPVTGVLTGTPGTVGQFVVGVRVREYRNGILISETIRDFQFNVLACPQPPPSLSVPDQTLNLGCSKQLVAQGISAGSATWKSVSPGALGAHNGYLSCTSNCLKPYVTATGTPPAYVDYVVCGVSTNCQHNNVCDTFRVTFNPALSVSIAPSNPALCNGQTSTTLTAYGSGGTPPYSYLWNNVNPSQTITVGAGTYNVKITDASGCQPAFKSAVVISYSVPVTVNAGPDKTRCIANPMASLSATVTGATGGIWSGGTGTFSPNNTSTSNLFYTPSAAELGAGSATLFITTTGNGACPADKDTIVIFYTGFTGSVVPSSTAVSCYAGNDGKASFSVTGGMAPHSYTWITLPQQTGSTAGSLTAGNYSVTITNSLGCTSQQTVAVTQPLPLAFTSTVNNVSCFGGANGGLGLTISGGITPYTYSWTPGALTTPSISTLTAGSYTFKVTDAKSCILTGSLTVTQPSSLTVVLSQTNAACFGTASGAISSTVTGATPPYSYTWTPGGASSSGISSLNAGTYTLNVSDNFNCLSTKTIVITQPPALSITATHTNESCNYLNNGSALANVSGGTPGYTYQWVPGNYTTAATSSLSAGNYTLSVNDLKGCNISTVVTITEPPVLAISFINPNHISCFGGSNGSVTANVSGGTPGYTYSWSPGATTASSLINVTAGTYTLLARDTRSCLATNTISITQPPLLSFSATTTSVTCHGGNTGSASLTVTGGVTPYTYFWLPGGQSTTFLNGLSAGTYTSMVTDANGCLVTGIHTIPQASSLSISFSATNVSCFSGSNAAISATVSGGSPPFSYTWSPSGSSANISGLPAGIYTLSVNDVFNCAITQTAEVTEPPLLTVSTTFSNETCDYLNNGSATVTAGGGTPGYSYLWLPGAATSTAISNLGAGTYSVNVTDTKSCTVGATFTVTEPAPLSVSILSVTPVSCFGGNNGAANVQALGGTPNYNYTWTPGGAGSTLLSNMIAGIYTVGVSDSHTCYAQATISITQPSSITITETSGNVSCNGGSNGFIALSPSGGTTPYAYFWLPGGQSTSSLSGLAAGIYTVMVTDTNACPASKVYTITESTPILVSFSVTDVFCFQGSNGTISTTVSGGSGAYAFSWSNSAITQSVSGVPAGTYTLTVTDSFSCQVVYTVTVAEPPALALSLSTQNESCDYSNNGSASVIVSGGTPGYTYLWQPGAIASDSLSALQAGSYTITATDSLGCSISSVAVITEPATLTVAFSNSLHVSCNGGSNGSATALGAGGTPNYSYTWTPGGSNSALANNLVAGSYTVYISDNNGCVAEDSLTLTEPTPLTLVPSISNVVCNGGNNGAISVSTNGGTGPYTHTIMPGNIAGANFTNLQPGTYSINTTDAQGCQLTTTLNITQPVNMSTAVGYTDAACGMQNGVASISITSGGIPPFTYTWMPSGGNAAVSTSLFAGSYTVSVQDSSGCVSSKMVNISNIAAPLLTIVSTTNVTCFGGNDGALTATHTPGFAPFTYSWSPSGGNTLTATGLTTGVYVLKLTDNLGCVSFATSTLVAEPPDLVLSISPASVSCFGGTNGGASVSVTGGTGAYSYTWQTGVSTGSTVSGLAAGIYSLGVSDGNNCVKTATFAVTEPAAPLSLSLSATPVSCSGGSDGSVFSSASGGTAPYNFVLVPGNFSGQNIVNLPAGMYTVTSTDNEGCVTSDSIAVTEPAPISLIPGNVNSNCSLSNGQASVVATGGSGGYTYLWSPAGGTAAIATGLLAGTYSVTVTDSNNCSTSVSLTVSDNPSPVVSVASVTNVSCFNGADGAATASVTGGTGPFTYTWSPLGGNTVTASGLTVGSYTVVVTSANNCTAFATSPVLTQPSQIFTTITPSLVSCFGGADGKASVAAFGGTPGYTYTWQSGTASGNSVTGLPAGSYTMLVTDTNNCVKTSSFTILQPAAPLSLSLSSTSVSCAGGSDGSISCTGSGGTSPYSFTCSPGNFSGPGFSNLSAGVYTVTATDLKGCSTQETVSVADADMIVLVTGSMNSNCSLPNGQASVTASGGTGSFSYLWQPAGGTASITTGLPAGIYSVTVTDSNNCTAKATETITDLPAQVVSVTSVTNVSCFGGADGAATASVTGGTGPFTFSWSPAGGTAATASGLSTGTYSVLVTSGNGCTVSAVSPLITQPSQIFINITVAHVSCFGGSNGTATANVFGGTGSYSYSWQAGTSSGNVNSGLAAGNYTLQVSDDNSCVKLAAFSISQPTAPLSLSMSSTSVSCYGGSDGTALGNASGGTSPYNYNWSPPGGTAATAGSLSAGVYTLTAIDSKGCTHAASVEVTQPLQPVSGIVTVSNVSCFGGASGSATVSPAGGTPGYSYTWSPAGGSAQSASGLSQGNYQVIVADVNNCAATISLTINEPPLLTATLTHVDPSCGFANGKIFSQVSGGTGPYTYSWSAGTSTASAIDSLAPGSYTLRVTDNLGCVTPVSASLTNIPGPTAGIASVQPVSCFGGNNGSSTITISQGTPPFIVQWSPAGGNNIIGSGFTAGTFTANITDSLGCLAAVTITVTEPPALSIGTDSLHHASCNGDSNGYVSVQASGGTPAYTYSWSTGATGNSISQQAAGTYTVYVQDQNGCAHAIGVTITEPAVLSSTITGENALCFSGTGGASVTVEGGTAPYTYSWSILPGQSGNTLNNAPGGTYTVFITDNNGCAQQKSVTITYPSQIITSVLPSDTVCAGKPGTLTATASGGSGGYYYSWAPAGITNSGTLVFTVQNNISYTVLAFDKNGCSGLDAVSDIFVYDLLASNVDLSGHTPICPGQSSLLEATVNGNTGPLSYAWSHGLPSTPGLHVVTPANTTSYVVTVSNACGRAVNDTIVVRLSPPPVVKITADTMITCIPGMIKFSDISGSVNSADPIVSWMWDFGDGNASGEQHPSHLYRSQGSFPVSLSVVSDRGCTSKSNAPLIIGSYPQPVAAFTMNATTLNLPYDALKCTNQSTGAVSYNWSFGNEYITSLKDPQVTLKSVGLIKVQLVVTSEFGCRDTTEQYVNADADVIFPTAFTPNEENTSGGSYVISSLNNDVFFPYTSGVSSYHLQIFNRWGELIFESRDINLGWDGYYRGTICELGVYVWKADISLENGKEFKKSGNVTLLR